MYNSIQARMCIYFFIFASITIILFQNCSIHGSFRSGEAQENLLDISNWVKWHPGHYYTIMSWGKDKSTYLNDVYAELQNTPALRGVQIRYYWSELEPEEGVYDFTAIENRLAELKSLNKYLIIQVQTKSFNPDVSPIPSYLKISDYEGGEFPYSSYGSTIIRGFNIKLWNSNLRNRLSLLFKALGKRFNDQSHFEGIGMIETALGQPINPITTDQETQFYLNLLEVHRSIRESFPNTMSIQEVNYPHTILNEFIETNSNSLANSKTGLSCPDVFPDETGLTDPGRAYSYLKKFSGYLPIAPQIMQTNYEWTVKDKSDLSGHVPTIEELLTFARDTLKSNYIFWTREPNYYNHLLLTLSAPSENNMPSGSLDPTCPTVYNYCDSN